MSKAKRKEAAIAREQTKKRFIALALAALLLIGVVLAVVNMSGQPVPQTTGPDPRSAALASEHAATLGDPNAKVHIVEFIDPACGTCAVFYPMVKQWLNEAPGKLRLTMRHVPFHTGVEYVVRVLEASREQDKYWETLEALLRSQRQWVTNHVVQPDRVLPAIASVGLDEDRLAGSRARGARERLLSRLPVLEGIVERGDRRPGQVGFLDFGCKIRRSLEVPRRAALAPLR